MFLESKRPQLKSIGVIEEKHSFALDFITSVYPVSDEYRKLMLERTYYKSFKKGEILVRKDEICSSVFYIKKGLIRGFIDYNAGEITTWISCENELVTSISGFFKRGPSKENIQAIEPCIVECLDADDLQELYTCCPESNIVTRLILEKYYQDAEDRAFVARLPTAIEKYNYILQSDSYSHLLNRAPLKFVASFLGMRLETLSRMRMQNMRLKVKSM